ncbi:TolC family outer membrane protein [Thiohalorhabdus sp.]|uniref:TolC family outer membrane protein n=1 Tax=Thiohalorhabdus sp. TaxID=3094134 RepID=UPI002FC2B29C
MRLAATFSCPSDGSRPRLCLRQRPGRLPAVALVAILVLGALPSGALASGLLELYKRAEEVDPNLKRSEKERVIADLQEDQAKAGWFPRLTGQASRSRTTQTQIISGRPETTEKYTQDQYNVTLTQPIYSGGRNWLALDIAEITQEQADATVSGSRQELMIQVAQAYFDILNAREEVDLAEREVNRVDEHLDRAQAQFEVGTGDIVGVREAEARRDQANTRLIRARNALNTAKQRLRQLIRRPVPELDGVEEVNLLAPDPGTPEKWVERALDANPQLAQTRTELSIARKNAELARRERWPQLSAQAQYSKVEGGSFITQDEQTSASLQLEWPIYQGGEVSARADIEDTRAAQTRLQLDDQQETVRVETVQAFYDWESAMEEVRSLRAQVRSAETQLEAIQTGFEVGRRTSVDVLDAQQEYFAALQSLAEARHRYLVSRLQLKAASGVLSLADLRSANRQLAN